MIINFRTWLRKKTLKSLWSLRYFSSGIKSDISEELLISASFSWMSDKPKTQLELADALKKNNIINTPEVYEVFKAVDRQYFCTDDNENPYSVDPDKLTNGQKLTSPVMQAIALEALTPWIENLFFSPLKDPIHIADIGFGYGSTTVMLSLLAEYLKDNLKSEREVKVTGYEVYSDFLKIANEAFTHVPNINIQNIELLHKDIIEEEVDEKYDIIHSAWAFQNEKKGVERSSSYKNFITPIVNPLFTSCCLLPLVRPDGEQDLTLLRYDPVTQELSEEADSIKDPDQGKP